MKRKTIYMFEFKTALVYLGLAENGHYRLFPLTSTRSLRFDTYEDAHEYLYSIQRKVAPTNFDIVKFELAVGA